ncbi:MAG: MBL fold metallo-hydrolase [Erysipelotrichales bacterium]
MKIYNLSSGSKANVTLVRCGDFNIVIDAGGTMKYIKESLASLDLSVEDIDIVLYTHFHTDHCAASKCFNGTPSYSFENLAYKEVTTFNDVNVLPFPLSHDEECLGFQIEYNNQKFTLISDTGYVKSEYLPIISESDYLYLEFNHDVSMLNNTNRPPYVKRRILSDKGHLNNVDAALVLVNTCDNLKELYVAHISDQANDVRCIQEVIEKVFNDYEKDITFDIKYTGFRKITEGGNI